MQHSTRTHRVRQRPRTRQIQRHLTQPWLWPEDGGTRPVFRQRRIQVRIEQRGQTTPYGGLTLAHALAMRLHLDRDLNRGLPLLRCHRPFFESDHLLTHVYNQYVGGRCIEDIGNLQGSDAVKHLLGAVRIPDPTTAGDFLRRFHEPHLVALQTAIDAARERVWRQLPRRRRQTATLDLDSTVRPVYGECKQGADFAYNGQWSYHPLLVTLAETREPLRTINRPGNAASAEGAAAALRELLPLVQRHFGRVYVRGDSKFYQRAVIAACEAHHAYFATVMDGYAVLLKKAEKLPENAWQPFSFHAAKGAAQAPTARRSRRKRERHRRRIAREREYKTLATTDQWAAEFPYTLPRQHHDEGLAGRTYRVVVKRQRVQESQGQQSLLVEYRYRFVITNIPQPDMDAAAVLAFAYGRCDQENFIEQFKNGIAALRMPTGELLANWAFLLAGQLAWCLRAWLSLLALPKETTR